MFHYPRVKPLDIYRKQKMLPDFEIALDGLDTPVTQTKSIAPLAFISPDATEALLEDISIGKFTGSDVSYSASIEQKMRIDNSEIDMNCEANSYAFLSAADASTKIFFTHSLGLVAWCFIPSARGRRKKMVLRIGKAALEHSDVKPYVHDVLLSMALAKCAIAKTSFEKSKGYEGFKVLARAQYLLKSKDSLGSMPLLSQIEKSLEEFAPAYTLELLSFPYISDNAERRRGAIAALRELLRQGLDVETFGRVQDWHYFLSQALKKMMAFEIADLLSWENLAFARKNNKLLESQN